MINLLLFLYSTYLCYVYIRTPKNILKCKQLLARAQKNTVYYDQLKLC